MTKNQLLTIIANVEIATGSVVLSINFVFYHVYGIFSVQAVTILLNLP